MDATLAHDGSRGHQYAGTERNHQAAKWKYDLRADTNIRR